MCVCVPGVFCLVRKKATQLKAQGIVRKLGMEGEVLTVYV